MKLTLDSTAKPDPSKSTPRSGSQPRIFVSYSRRDLAKVDPIVTALETRDIQVWIDRRNIPFTADFIAAIQDGVAAADIALLVLTPDSVASRMCQMEWDLAHKLGKRIVPVQFAPIADTTLIPDYVARLNWIVLSNDDPNATVTSVIAALAFDEDYLRTHTWLVLRTREWQNSGSSRSGLLSGSELKNACAWQSTSAGRQPLPTEAQLNFINASVRHKINLRIAQVALTFALAILAAIAAWQTRQATRDGLSTDIEAKAAQTNAMLDGPNQTVALHLITDASQKSLKEFGRLSPTVKGALIGSLDRVREVRHYQDDQAQIVSLAVNPLSGGIIVSYRSGDENAGKTVKIGAVFQSLDAKGRRLLETVAQKGDQYVACFSGSCVTAINNDEIRTVVSISGDTSPSPKLLASLHVSALDGFASGEWFLAGTRSGRVIKVWKNGRLAPLAQLPGPVELVRLNSRGNRAIVTTASGLTQLLDTTSGSMKPFRGLKLKFGKAFAWISNPNSILSAGSPGEVLRYDAGKTGPTQFAEAGRQRIGMIASSPSGDLLATTSDTEGMVYVLRSDGTVLFNGPLFGGVNPTIGFSTDSKKLYSAGYLDRVIRVFDLTSQSTLVSDIQYGQGIWKVSFCGTSGHVAWGDDEGRIGIVDAQSGKLEQSWIPDRAPEGRLGRVQQLLCTPNLRVAALHDDGLIRYFDEHGKLSKLWRIDDPFVDFVGLSNGSLIATTSKKLYRLSSDGGITHLFDASVEAFRLAIDESTNRIAIGSSGAGFVEIHSLSDGRLIVPRYQAHLGLVMNLAFSPWADLYASGGTLGRADLTPLSLWSSQGLRIRGSAKHPAVCTTLAFEPASRLLLSGGSEGNVYLWDEFLTQVGPVFARHTNMVTSIAVSPDGMVATAGGDGRIQVRLLDDRVLLNRAIQRLNEN